MQVQQCCKYGSRPVLSASWTEHRNVSLKPTPHLAGEIATLLWHWNEQPTFDEIVDVFTLLSLLSFVEKRTVETVSAA